ncbi:hypothetical protein I4U23_012071 [Adineta vaga]|nr:hypothetical protein I4U23_012071 [Adineta vaga]
MIGISRVIMFLAMIVLVFTLTVQARIDASKRCFKEHEIYNSCGTACPLNCDDVISSNLQKPCTLQCVPGCYCKKGYVRETDDKHSACVQMEDCESND